MDGCADGWVGRYRLGKTPFSLLPFRRSEYSVPTALHLALDKCVERPNDECYRKYCMHMKLDENIPYQIFTMKERTFIAPLIS